MTYGHALNAAAIADPQRAALAWRLRDILHEGDRRAGAWRTSAMPQLGEAAKSEYIRGELLGLVAELEGSRRLTLVSDDGEAGLTLAPPRPPDPRLRKVCGQYHAPDHTILHLTCGHHQRVSAPRPAEIWVRCEECWPAPSNGAA